MKFFLNKGYTVRDNEIKEGKGIEKRKMKYFY
jgi:hypothetical protein